MPSPQSSVLIVDDESSLRTALRSSLSASGFSVGEARNGEEALATVQHTPFDLVLLDINMPGISGIEACRRLREMAPALAIVMVTVRELEDDKVRALEAGADDYITKPFRYRELTARLRAVLRRTRTQPAAEPSLVLEAGNLKLDIEKRLLLRGSEEIRLSPTEFELLDLPHAQRERAANPRKATAHRVGPGTRRGPRVLEILHPNAAEKD